jgi:hypothetical protein
VLSEKRLKNRDHGRFDASDQVDNYTRDVFSFDPSLIERYAGNSISIHIHLFGAVGYSDRCICVAALPGIDNRISIGNPGEPRITRESGTHTGEQQMSMLVDVGQIIENAEIGTAGVPSVVRLQLLDFCNREMGHPREISTLDCLLEEVT